MSLKRNVEMFSCNQNIVLSLTSFSFSSSISFLAAIQFRVSMKVFLCDLWVTLCIKPPATLTHRKRIALAPIYNKNNNMKLVLVVLHLHSSKYIIEGLGLWCFTDQCFLNNVAVSFISGVSVENNWPAANHWKLYHMLYRVHYGSGERHWLYRLL